MVCDRVPAVAYPPGLERIACSYAASGPKTCTVWSRKRVGYRPKKWDVAGKLLLEVRLAKVDDWAAVLLVTPLCRRVAPAAGELGHDDALESFGRPPQSGLRPTCRHGSHGWVLQLPSQAVSDDCDSSLGNEFVEFHVGNQPTANKHSASNDHRL